VGRTLPLIVVLAIIVVIGGYIASMVLRSGEESAPAASPAAAAEFGPLSPSGEAGRENLAFTWAPHPRAIGYELVLEEASSGRPVWMARFGRVTSVRLAADLAAGLIPGQAYLWRVTAELPGGEGEESPALAFVVR
jgi:hypothetical protein